MIRQAQQCGRVPRTEKMDPELNENVQIHLFFHVTISINRVGKPTWVIQLDAPDNGLCPTTPQPA